MNLNDACVELISENIKLHEELDNLKKGVTMIMLIILGALAIVACPIVLLCLLVLLFD